MQSTGTATLNKQSRYSDEQSQRFAAGSVRSASVSRARVQRAVTFQRCNVLAVLSRRRKPENAMTQQLETLEHCCSATDTTSKVASFNHTQRNEVTHLATAPRHVAYYYQSVVCSCCWLLGATQWRAFHSSSGKLLQKHNRPYKREHRWQHDDEGWLE